MLYKYVKYVKSSQGYTKNVAWRASAANAFELRSFYFSRHGLNTSSPIVQGLRSEVWLNGVTNSHNDIVKRGGKDHKKRAFEFSINKTNVCTFTSGSVYCISSP